MEINEQDWELINDDGFIYWRPKRQRLDSTAAVPPPDPAAEAKARRERKKKALLKLKAKYEQEIRHWELLSNTLQALQERTQNQVQPPPVALPVLDQMESGVLESSSDCNFREVADNLLAQVEAQEAAISEISRLCDVAEALCDAEEQRLKQPFFDLPIWDSSPRELITSLLEE